MSNNTFEAERDAAGLRLRPFTIGSQDACEAMGLTVFTGGGNELTEAEVRLQVVAFAWLQSAPLQEVLRHLSQDTWRAEVKAFSFGIEPRQQEQLIGEINRISAAASAASVDVLPKPGHGKDDSPKN